MNWMNERTNSNSERLNIENINHKRDLQYICWAILMSKFPTAIFTSYTCMHNTKCLFVTGESSRYYLCIVWVPTRFGTNSLSLLMCVCVCVYVIFHTTSQCSVAVVAASTSWYHSDFLTYGPLCFNASCILLLLLLCVLNRSLAVCMRWHVCININIFESVA